jgi:hypothetical protein
VAINRAAGIMKAISDPRQSDRDALAALRESVGNVRRSEKSCTDIRRRVQHRGHAETRRNGFTRQPGLGICLSTTGSTSRRNVFIPRFQIELAQAPREGGANGIQPHLARRRPNISLTVLGMTI